MDQLTFVPTTGQFFLTDEQDGLRSLCAARLSQAGWPQRAHVLRAGLAEGPRQGLLIELLDALPELAALPEGEGIPPTLSLWARAARLGLSLVLRGRLQPRLRVKRGRAGDERVAGWEARWTVVLDPVDRTVADGLARELAVPVLALPQLRHKARLPADLMTHMQRHTGATLIRRFLDLCADTLVREASRRGAQVRLGHWPADAWEQRLVRALGDDRAAFAAPGIDVPALGRELRSLGFGASLLSPQAWEAPEPLQAVAARLTGPARILAERLSQGEPAPRTLAPAVIDPALRARLNQAIAVTRALLHKQAPADERKLGA